MPTPPAYAWDRPVVLAPRDGRMVFEFPPKARTRAPYVSIVVANDAAGPRVEAVQVRAVGRGGRTMVTSADLRAISPDALLRAAQQSAGDLSGETENAVDWWIEQGQLRDQAAIELRRLADRRRRREQRIGRGRGRGDEFYKWVALEYVQALAEDSRRIHEVIAEHAQQTQGLDVGRETVRDWIKRARELGFLTAGQQGRAGGELGPRFFIPPTTEA